MKNLQVPSQPWCQGIENQKFFKRSGGYGLNTKYTSANLPFKKTKIMLCPQILIVVTSLFTITFVILFQAISSVTW